MQSCFQKVAFSRVLAVEQFKQLMSACSALLSQTAHLKYEGLVNVAFPDIRVEFGAFNEAEEELVYDLEMWPSELEYRLVLFGVESISRRVHLRWYRSEEIGSKLSLLAETRDIEGKLTMLTTSG